MYDGTIKIDTSIDEAGFYEGIKKMSAKTASLNNSIANTKQKIEAIKKEMASMEASSTMTEEYKFLNDSLTKAEASMERLTNRAEKMEELGVKKSSKSWKSLQYDIENVKKEIEYTKAEMSDMRDEGSAFTAGANPAAYEKKKAAIEALERKLAVYNKRLIEATQKENDMTSKTSKIKKLTNEMGKLVTKGGGAGKAFANIGGKIGAVISRIGSLIAGVFFFNMIRSGLTKLREAFSTLLQANAEFNSSLGQIKANLMTAFYPIYSYALPAINALMSGLSRITGSIATFTANLFGMSPAKAQASTKALLGQAKAISAVGKASKGLSDIDDMHVLTDNSASGGAGALDGYNFGEIKTNSKLLDWLERMRTKCQPIVDALERLWEVSKPFAEPLLQGFVEGIEEIITNGSVEDVINLIADALECIDPDGVYAVAKAIGTFVGSLVLLPFELGEIFGTLLGDVGTFFDAIVWMIWDWCNYTSKPIRDLFHLPDISWPEAKQVLLTMWQEISRIFSEGGILGLIRTCVAGWKRIFTEGLGANFINSWLTPMVEKIKKKFTDIGTSISSSVTGAFKSAVNFVFSQIESKINSFISSINRIRSLINKIPGVSIPYISTVSLPRLATGTVVPANNGEFSAILGDNKREPEIVSPLSTMKQAIREVQEENGGGNRPIIINLTTTLDGREVYRSVVKYNNDEIDTTGNNPLFA